ncbi:cytochrome P450 [Gonapodya prolifera JEL478]|uniref:Cytochrome P450 n=1 Tax=Gonapodya prolifera (strain JEL478) TaxID=1344416 RepID=A0A139AFC0_GONPJ|nr:cytochrome P450 [Gonapodya prolifera JEL478]|eukprot:KXS15450.1 cytochrome P450 [Gonapodya prolifera JEL478]
MASIHPNSVRKVIKLSTIRIVLQFGQDLFHKAFGAKTLQYQTDFVKGNIGKRNEATRKGESNNDILQWIVDKEQQGIFYKVDMISMSRTMLAAGSETTANAMSWALAFLLQNTSALEKLRKELDDAFPGTAQQELPLDKLKHLPFLDAVLHETLRLRPLVSQVWREFEKDAELSVHDEDRNPKTYIIPAGTMTYIPIAAVQTSPKVWLRTKEFYPERCLSANGNPTEEEIFQFHEDANTSAKSSAENHGSKDGHWGKPVLCNKNAFMPFSLGSSDCAGRNFAWNEMRIICAHLVRRFDLLPAFDTSKEVPGADFITYQISAS